jgi:hypothetical protein
MLRDNRNSLSLQRTDYILAKQYEYVKKIYYDKWKELFKSNLPPKRRIFEIVKAYAIVKKITTMSLRNATTVLLRKCFNSQSQNTPFFVVKGAVFI